MKDDWKELLQEEIKQDYYRKLWSFVEQEYRSGAVYPPREAVFTAFELTGYRETRAVLLGQDPYHGEGQAHGLSFSVAREEARFPPTLRNLFRELESDLGVVRTCRDLSDWARQGVLLLNTALTVRAGKAASHRGKGWERFTDAVIAALNQREEPVVFVLWGADAQRKAGLIDSTRHTVIASAHPSPLSAHRGFFGSRPFSRVNACLRELGGEEIEWGDDSH